MSLTREEQRMLDSIENGLQLDDPAFAGKLNFAVILRHIRRQKSLAHAFLWLGMFMTLTGFAIAQALGPGVLFILDGLLLLVVATVAVRQLCTPVGKSPRRRPF